VTGPAWYWWAGTVALILDGWLLVAATGGLLLGRVLRRRSQAVTQTPAPGAAHGPRPAPGPTPGETASLAALHQARAHATPQACQAAQVIADGLRLRFPGLDDLTLGLVVLDLFGYTRALALGLPDPVFALSAVMDGFGLAAEELTRLTRTDVPR
jgi:hypothetical protein